MLENCKTLQERWGRVSVIIDRWLQNRQELLVGYCQISNILTFDSADPEQGGQLKSLCENLVDYISAGHFEVYQQLMEEGRAFGDQSALSEASELLNQIHPVTQAALDFNDKYLATDDLEALAADLSNLGESLAARFEIEDRMIEVLHNTHRQQATE